MTLLTSIKCCWSESFIKKNVWEGFLHSSLVLKFVAVIQSLLKGRKHERVLAELMELALFFVWFSRVVCKKLCNHMIITQIYFSHTQEKKTTRQEQNNGFLTENILCISSVSSQSCLTLKWWPLRCRALCERESYHLRINFTCYARACSVQM